jgi:hypothetical protein
MYAFLVAPVALMASDAYLVNESITYTFASLDFLKAACPKPWECGVVLSNPCYTEAFIAVVSKLSAIRQAVEADPSAMLLLCKRTSFVVFSECVL